MQTIAEQLARLHASAEQAAYIACEDVMYGRDATEHARLALEARDRYQHLRDEAFGEDQEPAA